MADYRVSWLIAALVLVAMQLAIGGYAKGHWLGILIDSRNKYSLSRLQIVLWTTVLVSAFFSVLYHLRTTSIYLPAEVWALMAISTGSATAAIMIKDTKGQQKPTQQAVDEAPATELIGVLAKAQEPRLRDMFLGEELADQKYVDIAKVQMFVFTLVAVIGYISSLDGAALCVPPPELKERFCAYFPPLSASLVTIIGISHAGYLAAKVSPKTQTQAG
jgi:hypothetical protein